MPVVPQLANECLDNLGLNKELRWPSYDNKLIEEKNTLIVIQINGKKRGLVTLPKNSSEDDLLKLIMTDDKISKYIEGKDIKKKIYIKDKLLNVII